MLQKFAGKNIAPNVSYNKLLASWLLFPNVSEAEDFLFHACYRHYENTISIIIVFISQMNLDKTWWWLLFLHDYNGISIIPDVDWSSPDAIIFSDACLKGIGGVNFTTFEYFHSDIPESLRDMHISVLEMYAIYIAIQFWTSSISNKRVQLFCDNQSCVEILKRGSGRNQEMLNLARQIWYCVR